MISKQGNQDAVRMAYTAMGIAPTISQKIDKLLAEYGYETFTFPYAMNPRELFFYNLTATGIKSRYFTPSISPLSVNMQRALFIAEIVSKPHLLQSTISIRPGLDYYAFSN